MKAKKAAKLLFSAAIIASMIIAPVSQITAAADQTLVDLPYREYWEEDIAGNMELKTEGGYAELRPDTSDVPEMPDVLKNRKPKHHVFERREDHSINFRSELIMPGDTFEIPNDITRDHIYTIDFYGRDDDIYANRLEREDSSLGNYAPEKYGIEVTGSVDIVETDHYDSGSGKSLGGEHVEDDFFRTAKNNLNCPIIVGPTGGGGDGPYVFYEDHDQRRAHTNVGYAVLAPYYFITYQFIDDNFNLYTFDDLFWPAGEFDTLDFPEYYWLTDVPYTLKVPNPRTAGRSFYSWVNYDFVNFTYDDHYKTEDFTELSVLWTYDVYTELHNKYTVTHEDSDGTTYETEEDDVYWRYRLPENFEGINIHGGGALSIMPTFNGNHRTIEFDGNGGSVKGRDKWLIEVNEVKREDTPKYGENGDSRIPDDGDFGFDINDFTPEKEGDTFLGWCANPSALYSSYVTKDSTIEAYRYFWENDEYGTFTDEHVVQNLYAKWASETSEDFEKNAWKLDEDGTLHIMNDEGAENWNAARQADPTLAPKVKAIELGYKDEAVKYIPDRCFEGCTGLEKMEFGENISLGAELFAGCTALTDVTLNSEPSRWGDDYYTFRLADKDIVVHVPDEYLDGYKESFGDYAYLLEKPKGQRYALSVNGTVFTDDNLEVKCGDGTASFDPSSNTLTLDNAVLSEALTPHCCEITDSTKDTGEAYPNAAVVSGLDKLTIVIKGTVDVNTVAPGMSSTTKDDLPRFVRAYGDLEIEGGKLKSTVEDLTLYYKDEETMDFKDYVGPGKVGATVLGDLSLKNVNAERLYADIAGDLTMDNSELLGGQIIADGDITANNSTVRHFDAPEGDMKLTSELAAVSSRGSKSSYTNCKLQSILLSAGDNAESLTLKNCEVYPASTIRGNDNTKFDVLNTSIEAYNSQSPVTNIPEKNISVADGKVKQGGWNESNVFILEATGETPSDPTVSGVYGDLDGDTEITANDALIILRSSVGMTEFSNEQTTIADVDGDSSITANDALEVLRSSVGMADESGKVGTKVTA